MQEIYVKKFRREIRRLFYFSLFSFLRSRLNEIRKFCNIFYLTVLNRIILPTLFINGGARLLACCIILKKRNVCNTNVLSKHSVSWPADIWWMQDRLVLRKLWNISYVRDRNTRLKNWGKWIWSKVPDILGFLSSASYFWFKILDEYTAISTKNLDIARNDNCFTNAINNLIDLTPVCRLISHIINFQLNSH